MGAHSENTLQHSQTMNNKRNSPKTMFPIHHSTLSVMERLPGQPTHHTCIYTMKCSMCSSFLTADLLENSELEGSVRLKKIRKLPVQARRFEKREEQNLRGVSKVMCWTAVWGLHKHDVCNKEAPLVFSLIKNECRFQE